jgi:hypothetical protein
MRLTARGVPPYMLAVLLVSIAYFTSASSAPPRAAAPDPPPLHTLAPDSGKACHLPPGKQVAAAKAFAEMMPVFRHPRCANCHGAFDVLSLDEHSGAVAARASKLDPTALLTVPERVAFHQGCPTCHNQIEGHGFRRQLTDSVRISGWMLPPAPMRWVGKNTEQLCTLMKGFEENADSMISHFVSDHGEVKFVQAAFEGRRALDSATMDTYDVVPEPPPGSITQLIAQGTRWARLVGDHWKDSPGCGCQMPDIRLKVHHTMDHQLKKALITREASQADFEIKLLPMGEDKPGAYAGSFDDARRIEQSLMKNCRGGGVVNEHWTFYVTLAPNADSLTVWRTLVWDNSEYVIDCGRFGRLDDQFRDSELGSGEPFTMAADSGSTTGFRVQHFGDTETLTITVIEVPKGE